MFDHLDIYDRRERTLVGLADAGLSSVAWSLDLLRPPRPRGTPPGRILLLRLERIGDLLMTLGAIRAVRQLAPHAVIDLVVGSWNEAVAQAIGGLDRVQVLDAPWLARGGAGASAWQLARRALRWRRQHYDLAINFEPDVRSNLLMAGALARRRAGFGSAGGGPLLTDAVPYDPRRHVAANALALVESAFDREPGSLPGPWDPEGRAAWRLAIPADVRERSRAVLRAHGVHGGERAIAVHVPGGRAIKQWPPERFADAAARLADEFDAAVLLTGSAGDRAVVDDVCGRIAGRARAYSLAGALDVLSLGAVLADCRLLVTGDTGPMHLAAAVGTPIVAVFGPSSDVRYAPLASDARIARIDLPCSPCNRIRLPPARCVGHTPDCLEGVTVERVIDLARELIGRPAPARAVRP